MQHLVPIISGIITVAWLIMWYIDHKHAKVYSVPRPKRTYNRKAYLSPYKRVRSRKLLRTLSF